MVSKSVQSASSKHTLRIPEVATTEIAFYDVASSLERGRTSAMGHGFLEFNQLDLELDILA